MWGPLQGIYYIILKQNNKLFKYLQIKQNIVNCMCKWMPE